MRSNDKDDAYFPDKEEAPKIKACLMHPHREAKETFEQEAQEGYAGVRYGLCHDCVEWLGDFLPFQRVVNEQIKQRLNQLKKGNRE